MISEINSGLNVTDNLISFNFGVGASAACDATALVLLYLVALDVWRRVEEDDPISVVDDVVTFDPGESALDHEDAFGSTLTDSIVKNYSVTAGGPAIRDVCLVISHNLIFLNMGIRRLDQ